MKKVSVAILALLYLVVTSGIAMDTTFCMGKFSSVDLYNLKDRCGKCGMKTTTGGCCKHEYKIIKLNDTHQSADNNINLISPVLVLNNSANIFDTELCCSESVHQYNNHSPPISPGVPLNILHCVFRI